MIHLKNLPRRHGAKTTGVRIEVEPYQKAIDISARLGLTVQDYMSAALEEANERHTVKKPAAANLNSAWHSRTIKNPRLPVGVTLQRRNRYLTATGAWSLDIAQAQWAPTVSDLPRILPSDTVVTNALPEGGAK